MSKLKAKESKSNKYFATLRRKDLAPRLIQKVEQYYDNLGTNHHIGKIRRTYEMYYGLGEYSGAKVHTKGKAKERLEIRLNHLRSILNNILVLTTQNKPPHKAIAINSDHDSQASARLGDSLTSYYLSTENVETDAINAAEMSLITTKAYLILKWDVNKGKQYGVDKSEKKPKVRYDGDIAVMSKSCLDVAEDIYKDNGAWYIFMDRVNRFDLIAQYPEKEDQILLVESEDRYKKHKLDTKKEVDDDLVTLYTFRHKKTPALPEGREVEFLSDDLILNDIPLPYPELMIYSISPGKIQGTNLGYTPAFDIIAPNLALNDSMSTIITNLATFGVGNIWTPPGSGVRAKELAGGLRHLESAIKPEPVNFTLIPAESFKIIDTMETQINTLSGINQVIRGTPQPSLKSGSALGMVAAQAITYNSGFQKSYSKMLMNVTNGIIEILKKYMNTPKVMAILGESNREMVRKFTGEDLLGIHRIIFEEVSPATQSMAGRWDLANSLLASGLFTEPEQYIQLIETGSIKPLVESISNENLDIEKENDMLRTGEAKVIAIITDMHGRHVRGHKRVINDPILRQNSELLERVTTHIQEHIDQAANMSPALAAMLREEQVPKPQPPQQQPKKGGGGQSGPSSGPQQQQAANLPKSADAQTQKSFSQVNKLP